MDNILRFLILVAVGATAFFLLLLVSASKQQNSWLEEQTKISRQAHILNMYAEYQANMNGCRQQAIAAKKDEEFIQANCVEVINSSMIGSLLKEWGKSDLLVTK